MKACVLVGSTETDFFLLFSHILGAAGYRTLLVKTVAEITTFARERDVRAILLDADPGHFPAAEACQIIHRNDALRRIRTIAIVGSQPPSQHLDLISAGVDEIFVRPFAPTKLLEYLHRHSTQSREVPGGTGRLQHSDVVLDLDERRVTRRGAAVHLAPTEFALLICLMRKPGKVCTRAELLEAAWPGRRFVEGPTLNVHIGRLRKALNSGQNADLIQTVRFVGYIFGSRPEPAVPIGGTSTGDG
jgi:two-component system phosphate regulon response regulator PhoB